MLRSVPKTTNHPLLSAQLPEKSFNAPNLCKAPRETFDCCPRKVGFVTWDNVATRLSPCHRLETKYPDLPKTSAAHGDSCYSETKTL